MANGCYIGVSGKARKVKKCYIGVGGKARKVKKAYIGVGGKARLCYAGLPAVGTPLNDMSWEEISQISAADLGASYFAVGDCKAVNVNGTVGTESINGTYYVYIIGFNHNEALEGKGIHFGGFKTALSGGRDIALIDSYYDQSEIRNGTKYFQMNHRNPSASGSNYGGWGACDMRYDVLGSTNRAPSGYGSNKTVDAIGYDPTATCATNPVANTLMAALPADLRAVMQPMTKYTDNKGNQSNVAENVTATIDYLPLLAEFEIFGDSVYSKAANRYEKDYQAQYAYYSSGNPWRKMRHNSVGQQAGCFLRSPYAYSYYRFCYLYSGADRFDVANGQCDACQSCGLAPIFKV